MPKLYAFLDDLNFHLSTPSPYVLIIEFLSALQILHLILKTMQIFMTPHQFILNSLFKNISFFTAGFEISRSNNLVHTVWWIFTAYLACFIMIQAIVFIQKKPRKSLLRILAKLYILHAKIIFFPIQFFFSSVLSLDNKGEYYNKTGWVAIMIVFNMMNHLLAIIKEFFIYRITQNEDAYSAKNNLYHQMILIFKMVSLLMIFASQGNITVIKATSVLQLLFSLGFLWIIGAKIPFYNFKLLKAILIFSAVYVSFSFLSMIQVFSKDEKVQGSVDFLVLLLPVFTVKIAMIRMKAIFQKILEGNFLSPEHAIHFGILLEELIAIRDGHQKNAVREFLPNHCIANGILINEREDNNDYEKRAYRCILGKLEYILTLHPKSEMLLIYMAEIYITKLSNIPKFLELLRRFESIKHSMYTKSMIEQFYSKINNIYENEDRQGNMNGGLELSDHFKFSKFTKIMKKKISQELQKHIEFWTDIEKQVLDVKQTVDRVLDVDTIHHALQAQFGKNYEEFRSNSPQVLLMYAIYLHNVRFLFSEGTQLLRKFELFFANQLIENKIGNKDLAMKPAVVAIISLDRKKSGQIIDISGPLNDVFHAKKNSLIGMNFGCLFPTAIAKVYQEQIYEYSKVPTYKLDHKFKTYGKTTDGEIFELEAHFQLYCYGNKEITVALLMKKNSENQVLVIAGTDGAIVDSSKGFKDVLSSQGMKINPPCVLQDLSYQFDEINMAFNSVYSCKDNIQQLSNVLTSAGGIDSGLLQDPMTVVTHRNSRKLSDNFLGINQGFGGDSSRPLNDISTASARDHHSDHSKLLDQERALIICEEFLKGKDTVLNPRVTSASLKREVLKARVQIKPYIVGSEIYKVIILTNIKRNGSVLLVNSDEEINSPEYLSHEETFGDEFPEVEEKVIIKHTSLGKKFNDAQIASRKFSKGAANFSFEKIQKNNKNNQEQGREPESSVKLQNEEDNNQTKIAFLERGGASEYASYKESLQKDTRIMRTLQDISVSKKLHPALKSSIIVVFLVIISILFLAGINYIISEGSIKEINKGIKIVSIGTNRLTSLINTWQDATYLYLEALNPGFMDQENLDYFLYDMGVSVKKLAKVNNQLKDTLTFLEDEDFVKKTFESNIVFWNPESGELAFDKLDTFTATDLLVNKYLMIADFKSLVELKDRDEIPYTLNNTVNDYMLESYDITLETEEYLQNIINRNILTIHNILALENTVLFLFCLAVILVAIVIRNGLQRLFKVLIRIQQEGVAEHLIQLKKVQAFLEEDVDTKYFTKIALEIFHGARSKAQAKKVIKRARTNKNSTRNSHYIMKYMTLYLLRIVLTACLIVPIIAGLFGWSLSLSIKSFNDFEGIKEQVSLLGGLSYQCYLFLNIYNYQVIFNGNPSYTVLNNKPLDVLNDNLNKYMGLNRALSDLYLNKENPNIDRLSIAVVKNNACQIFTGHTLTVCLEHAERTGINGLFSIGIEFFEISKSYIQQYLKNPTPENALQVSSEFTNNIGDLATILQNGYPALRAHILEILEEKVESANREQRDFLGIISAIILLYAGFIYVVPLKKFKELDLARRRLLKLIPHQIIQENRMLSFYLIKDFKNEVDTIKNIL